MDNVTYKQVESETITVSDTAVGFTSDKLTSATLFALCYVEGADIMIDCANTPTSSTGIPIKNGQWFKIWMADIPNFKAIRKDSTDATLYVLYYELDKQWSVNL